MNTATLYLILPSLCESASPKMVKMKHLGQVENVIDYHSVKPDLDYLREALRIKAREEILYWGSLYTGRQQKARYHRRSCHGRRGR